MIDGLAEFDCQAPESGVRKYIKNVDCFNPGAPALFLDRDGVLNRDTGYVGDTDRLEIWTHCAPLVKAANAAGFPVVIVTNQSGIGRGYYGWREFEAITAKIVHAFLACEAHVNGIYACAYHKDGIGAYAVDDHAWRKPNPGMFNDVANTFGIRRASSLIVGDRMSDILAGGSAGLGRGVLVGSQTEGVLDLPSTFQLSVGDVSTLDWDCIATDWIEHSPVSE